MVIYPSRPCQRYADASCCNSIMSISRSIILRYRDLLGSDLGVLLNGDLIVGLEGRDEVVWELGASHGISIQATADVGDGSRRRT